MNYKNTNYPGVDSFGHSSSDTHSTLSVNSYTTSSNLDLYNVYPNYKPIDNYTFNPSPNYSLNNYDSSGLNYANVLYQYKSDHPYLTSAPQQYRNDDMFDMSQLKIISQLLDTTQNEESDNVDQFKTSYSYSPHDNNIYNSSTSASPTNNLQYSYDYPGLYPTTDQDNVDFNIEIKPYEDLNQIINFSIDQPEDITCNEVQLAKPPRNTRKRKPKPIDNADNHNSDSTSDIYVSWIPKNARCKLNHELPDDINECEKIPEYLAARDKMIHALKKLGFSNVKSITFHPPRGSHIIIHFASKELECLFLERYKVTPEQWKLDMHKVFKVSKKILDSIKELRVDTSNKFLKARHAARNHN